MTRTGGGRCRGPCGRRIRGLLAALALVGCSGEETGAPPEPEIAAPPAGPADSSPAASGEEPLERPVAGDRAAAMPAFQRALQLRKRGRSEQALRALDKALKADPAFFEARLGKAEILKEEGPTFDLVASLREIRLAALLKPNDSDALLAEGLVRYLLGQFEASGELLREWVEAAGPGNESTQMAGALEALARVQMYLREHDAAQELIERALALAPNRAPLYAMLAEVAGQRGEVEAQEELLDRALARDPYLFEAHNQRQRLLTRSGRKEEAAAEREICFVLRRFRDDTSQDFQLDYAGRAQLWRKLGEFIPGPATWVREWREWVKAEEDAEVIEIGERLFAAGAGDAEIVYHLALARLRSGDRAGAWAMVERAAELEPTPPPAALDQLRRELTELERQLQDGEGGP